MVLDTLVAFGVAALKFIAIIIASVVASNAIVWLLAAIQFAHRTAEHLRQSERSMWYHAGRASVYLQVGVRNPRSAAIALTAGVAVAGVTHAIESAIGEVSGEDNGNPPPEIPPIQADNLRMPTTYPFKRVRALPWPPFFGHRFSLGDRGV